MRIGAQTPRVGRWPGYAVSAAPEFIDLAESAGLVLDPWQQFVLTHGLGERPDGRWAATKCSCWVPRQNGKGGIIEALELGWLFLLGEKLILHSAHEYKTAQEAYLRIKGLCEQTPDLDRRVNRYWQANGEQGIELTKSAGGARLRFVARSRTSGRGFSGGKNVLDEAQELTAQQRAAMLPTLSAQPNPQEWFFGTPPDDPAAWAYGLRADGEAGADRIAHFDWGADLDVTNEADRRRAARDRDLWYACNPSLGIRITEEFVEDEAKPSGLGDKFSVERLGAWLPRASDGASELSVEAWLKLTDPESRRQGDVAFAVDVTPSRDSSCISVYGLRSDGLGHVEVADHRPGTDWVVDRLVALRERWDPVAIGLDVKGPAGSLLVPLEKAGITSPEDAEHPRRGDLAIPSVQEVGAACGQFADAVRQGTLRHIGQEVLDSAVRGVKTRPLGEAWAWGRRVSSTDISPVVSVTIARWAYEMRMHLLEEDYDVADSFG
ncbi:terminase [Nonomuraea typhae]|uniref:terminase n=1 Tax=Nonomuraea typhae TaxID=2603600 RepID=UPI0015E1DA5B|nr:terminase [Nonomuraea typhae]